MNVWVYQPSFVLRSVAGNDIATSLECTETEAKTFLDQFLSSASQQIDADSYDLRMQISICMIVYRAVLVTVRK